MSEEKRLRELVLTVFDGREDAITISPAWLATETMVRLDPGRTSDPTIYLAAHLQFRQVARDVLRGRFQPQAEPDEEAQHPLFPMLQRRYPLPHKRGEEPVYKRLEDLSSDEAAFNVARLSREAAGKLKHADALEAWRQQKFKQALAAA